MEEMRMEQAAVMAGLQPPRDAREVQRERVTVEDARHVLFEMGDYELGVEPGSFTTLLMRAYRRADSSNRLKVWREWPGLAVALDEALTEQGLDWLRDLVKGADR